ncbi:pyridoxal phosphate-dependent aminotransferase [Rhodosalinus halophilus]|uniref:Aminotransferase n=1 Tax=Rhodosalinus halophilus TaxID=2259333 RepID=A0A365U434_9RHOB|nr:aminotransferase class I/II-fold pyridoxal phosphate-dependent enzyme [Rhodosalinus halophilus]RBI82859.1 pyridoxal phosphate-dependent aminotransferase [Rhodosalinus halophilus]
MRLSRRIEGITGGGSDGWELFYRARALKAAGEEVLELTVGEHDWTTPRPILDAMHAAALAGHTGYAVVPGLTELRQAVAARLAERTGVATGVENVLITPGGQAGLFAAHMAVCDPGDRALHLDPYYATYPGTIRAAGATPVAVETRPDDGFQPRAADLDAAAQGARALLVNTPNNPTGAVYSRATLDGVAEAARTHDLWLISDEVYDTQVWEGTHLSPRALPGMAERTLVVGSLSKSHAMTGSRLGWVVGPEEAIARMIDLATVTTYGVPTFIQQAAVTALGQPALEREGAEVFRRRRDLAARTLDGCEGLRLLPAQGAMYVMLDIRPTGLSGEAFAHALLDAHRIAVMPGESFGQAAAGHLRVALTVADDRLEAALETLARFAAALAAEAA